MDCQLTENNRNYAFRLYSVTEIIPSPYGGKDFRWLFPVLCHD
jgi:hypothetical protein